MFLTYSEATMASAEELDAFVAYTKAMWARIDAKANSGGELTKAEYEFLMQVEQYDQDKKKAESFRSKIAEATQHLFK